MEQVNRLSWPAKRMIWAIAVSSLVFIAGGALYYRSFSALPFALGVILAAALNVVKVVLLERTAQKAIEFDEGPAGKNYVRFQFLLRYLLTGLILIIAALAPFIDLWGAIAGVFTLQIAAVSIRFTKSPQA